MSPLLVWLASSWLVCLQTAITFPALILLWPLFFSPRTPIPISLTKVRADPSIVRRKRRGKQSWFFYIFCSYLCYINFFVQHLIVTALVCVSHNIVVVDWPETNLSSFVLLPTRWRFDLISLVLYFYPPDGVLTLYFNCCYTFWVNFNKKREQQWMLLWCCPSTNVFCFVSKKGGTQVHVS